MTTNDETRRIVRGYFDTWTSGDVAGAGRYLAKDVAFRGTAGSVDGVEAHLDALGAYRKLVTTGNEMLGELYGDDEAMLIYNSHTVAGVIPSAEHFRLIDGRIAAITLIFNPTPSRAMRANAANPDPSLA